MHIKETEIRTKSGMLFPLHPRTSRGILFRKVNISICYVCCEQDINNIMHINAGAEQYAYPFVDMKKASGWRPFSSVGCKEGNRKIQLFRSHQLRSGPRYHQSV